MLRSLYAEELKIGTTVKQFLDPASYWYFIRSHWRGDLQLFQAFWINLVLIRIGALLLAPLTHPPIMQNHLAAVIGSIFFILAAHCVAFTWQIVGTVRACDRFQNANGEVIPVYGAYFGIAVCLLFTLSSAFTAVQNTFLEPVKTTFSHDLKRILASSYQLSISSDGTSLHLDGIFERGLTAKLEAALDQGSGVKRILLLSKGGNIFEARGVSRVITEHGLNTHVDGTCYSACVRAFIAGQVRTLSPNASLGFHRYKLDANYPAAVVNVYNEQDEDSVYYRSRGINEDFIAQMFDAVQPDMWVPSLLLLQEAGVAHRLATHPTE